MSKKIKFVQATNLPDDVKSSTVLWDTPTTRVREEELEELMNRKPPTPEDLEWFYFREFNATNSVRD